MLLNRAKTSRQTRTHTHTEVQHRHYTDRPESHSGAEQKLQAVFVKGVDKSDHILQQMVPLIHFFPLLTITINLKWSSSLFCCGHLISRHVCMRGHVAERRAAQHRLKLLRRQSLKLPPFLGSFSSRLVLFVDTLAVRSWVLNQGEKRVSEPQMIEQTSEITLARLSRLQCHCRIKGHLVEHENIWGGRETGEKRSGKLLFLQNLILSIWHFGTIYFSIRIVDKKKKWWLENAETQGSKWLWLVCFDANVQIINVKLQRRNRQHRTGWVSAPTTQSGWIVPWPEMLNTGRRIFFLSFFFGRWYKNRRSSDSGSHDLVLQTRREKLNYHLRSKVLLAKTYIKSLPTLPPPHRVVPQENKKNT